MKLSKSFIYKDLYKELTGRYGGDKADAIWQYAETEYERLQPEHPGADCCDYRLKDSRGSDPETIYRTEISDGRWLAYDIPGNLGWIAYFAGLGRMIKRREYGSAAVCAVPATLMGAGIIELISERIAGLDRELPRKRLYRGFGALSLGGLTGIAAGALAGKGARSKSVMSGGAALCAVFAGLLLGGYKKK